MKKLVLIVSWMLVVLLVFTCITSMNVYVNAIHFNYGTWVYFERWLETGELGLLGEYQAVQPVDQVNPSSRRDTTGCDWAGVARTVALTLMKHARVPRHTLLEMVRRQVRPPCRVRCHWGHTQQALMGTLHGHVRWPVSSKHALWKRARRGHIHA